MIRCKTCLLEKEPTEFHKKAGAHCKVCTRAKARKYCQDHKEHLAEYQREWREQNAKHVREVKRDYRARNAEAIAEAKRAYYLANKEQLSSQKAAYKKANRPKFNAMNRERHFAKKNATPVWRDKDAIEAVYAEAYRLSAETGIVHHVDHIVPLKSKLVCGLHCEANLQILTASDNISKLNRWWPNMP